MSISSLGVGSGLDLEALVTGLVNSQKSAKNTLYNDKIADFRSEVSALGSIASAISSFETAVKELKDSNLFTARSATLTQPDVGNVVSVTADSAASNGTYSISVEQLAQGSRSMSAAGAFTASSDEVTATGGKMTFTAGTETFSIDVAGGATLSDLREQINDAADNFGVSANLIDDGNGSVFLSLTSSITGSGNDLVVTNDDASLDAVSSVATGVGPAGLSIAAEDAAQDAIIEVDGITINSDSNTFENAVSGLTIKALKEAPGEIAEAEINFDKESVKTTLDSFVSAYNKLQDVLAENTKAGKPLNGSSLVRNLESNLTNNLMTTFTNAGALETVFDLGIKLDNNGKMSLDATKFDAAVNASYDDIATLFSSTDGLGDKLSNMLDLYSGTGGLIETVKKSVQESQDKTEESKESFAYRMDEYERSLRQQFTALDTTLATMNSNGNYLLTMLDNL